MSLGYNFWFISREYHISVITWREILIRYTDGNVDRFTFVFVNKEKNIFDNNNNYLLISKFLFVLLKCLDKKNNGIMYVLIITKWLKFEQKQFVSCKYAPVPSFLFDINYKCKRMKISQCFFCPIVSSWLKLINVII